MALWESAIINTLAMFFRHCNFLAIPKFFIPNQFVKRLCGILLEMKVRADFGIKRSHIRIIFGLGFRLCLARLLMLFAETRLEVKSVQENFESFGRDLRAPSGFPVHCQMVSALAVSHGMKHFLEGPVLVSLRFDFEGELL
jgi:hypothetical protein